MRGTTEGVLCLPGELRSSLAVGDQEHVPMRACRQPMRVLQAFQSGCEIGKDQTCTIQTVTLSNTKHVAHDRLESECTRPACEILHGALAHGRSSDRPVIHFPIGHVARSRTVSKLKREVHIENEHVGVQRLLRR